MLERCSDHSKQCRNSVVMLCCSKNRRCESSCVTSPSNSRRRKFSNLGSRGLLSVWTGKNGKERRLKGDVTRDDFQRRFLTQLIISTLLQHCFECFQHCSNIATLCWAKSRPGESSRLCYTGRFATTIFNATQHFHIVATLFQHCYAVLGKKS